MATVKYLNSTVTLQYDADDFQYISSHAQKIIDAAQSVGVSIGALAGAMVEEYSAYSSLPRYARELIIDGAAQLFTHEAIAENYALVKSDSSIGDEDLDRIQNVALVDVGASNIKIETAIDIVLGFHSKYPQFQLSRFLGNYDDLVAEIVDQTSNLTEILYAIYIKEYAEKFFIDNQAYPGQWDALPQVFKDSLLVTYTNRGGESMLQSLNDMYQGRSYTPLPGPGTTAGINHLANSQGIGATLGLAGYGSEVQGVDSFSYGALLPGAGGIAYRYALQQLRFVVIDGLDYSSSNSEGQLELYDPETGEGEMTEEYIQDALQAVGIYAAEQAGSSPSGWADAYVANVRANWSTTIGSGSRRIIFGSDESDAMIGGSAADRLYGGLGDDVINGGNDKDYLEGNGGADSISGGDGDDEIHGGMGDDYLYGDAGKDSIHGGNGDDIIYGQNSDSSSGTDEDKLYGDKGNDVLYGSAGRTFLDGGEGQDELRGGEGSDIYKADSNDLIVDEDGKGSVFFENRQLTGGTRKEEDPENEYRNGDLLYVYNEQTQTMTVNGLAFEQFTNGDLGIFLETEPDDDEEKPDMGDAETRASPLVIDLDGDGVESAAYSRDRYFDHDANGLLESTAWAGSDDGLLVRDLNGNGRIDSGRELFGNNTRLANGGLAGNGFLALSDLDANQDGLLDSQDAAFSELRVWRDANGNGITDSGELLTLGQAGVTSIRTQWTTSNLVDGNGQAHRQIGSGIRSDGSTASISDIWFTSDASRRINGVDVSPEALFGLMDLPDAKAFGNLMDLRQAMALDATLRDLVVTYVDQQDSAQRTALLRGIIFQWAGVTDIVANSRGGFVDARELAVVELLSGRPYTNQYTPNDPNPRPEAGNLLTGEFNEFLQYVGAQIEAQSQYADTGIFLGGFASGYRNVVIDWDAFKQYMIAAHDEPDVSKITDLVKLSTALASYSPSMRAQLESAYLALIAQRPGIAPLIDVVNSVIGTAGTDVLYGSSGKDAINGQGGDDTLYGHSGDDIYLYKPGDGNDRIFDSSGSDQIYFMGGILPEHLSLTRDVSSVIVRVTINGVSSELRINNVFEGTEGALREGVIEQFRFENGTLWNQSQILAAITQQATSGNDGLYGSSADEVFFGLEGNDEIAGYGGNDTIHGDAGNDDLLGGTGNDVLNGGDGDDTLDAGADDDVLSGGAGSDALFGGAGDDTLSGGAGNDTLRGGTGSDTYIFNLGDGQDTIFDYDQSSGRNDVLQFGEGIDPSAVTARRSNDDLVLTIAGTSDRVVIRYYFQNDGEAGYHVDEIRFFGEGATVWNFETIRSLVLVPTSGDDVLRGYETADTIAGGEGNDTLHGQGGDDTLLGQDGADTAYGGSGDDTIIGGAGNDVLHGEAGSDLLNGDAGSDTLYGGADNDHLVGGLGDDHLTGGEGDDNYYFSAGDGQDTITDTQGLSTIYLSGLPLDQIYFRRDGTSLVLNFLGSPDDHIRLTDFFDPLSQLASYGLRFDAGNGITWQLSSAELDEASLLGTALNDVIHGNSLDNAIGGGGGDDTLYGNGGSDSLDGGAGDDALHGQAGNDLLSGGDGSDHLDGGTGADQLLGGAGDDTYVVDDTGDVVTEVVNSGADTIRSSISYALPDNVERLELIGTEAIDATGNDAGNALVGNLGDNVLRGLAGDDTLDGGAGNDVLEGGHGHDVLDGGVGIDQLIGGIGDDRYRVDDSSDVVVELAGQGADTVESTAYSYTLSDNVEHLILVDGSNAYEAISGIGSQTLTGNSYGNRLDGGVGSDTLIGGLGDDIYVIDSTGDVIVENADEGTDTVESSISYTLGATLENLTLLGSADLNATGNDGDNVIQGNEGSNRIEGGEGADTLSGGAGDDYYVAVSADDSVHEYAGEGVDTVERVFETNLVLESNVENLILGAGITTGNGNGLDNTIAGNAEDNTLGGWGGDDVLHGLDGDDALFGGDGTDTLLGGIGNDYLDGGVGVDLLEGGAGNDVYIINDSADVVVEAAGAGTDQIQTTASYALSANIENLFLMEGGAIDGTGNALDNYIAGNSDANVIDGGAGSDTLVAGAGDDSLIGGTGDDKYVFDENSGSDVIDNSDGGFDGVFFTGGVTRERLSFSRDGDDLLIFIDAATTPSVRVLNHFLGGNAAIDYVQPDGGFYLTTTEINQIVAGGGTGGEYDQVIEGTASGEQLVGGTGKDLIKGLAGNDQLFGMGGNDTLQGGDGDDYLAGGNGSGSGSGNDRLEGGAGADTLAGQDGANALIGGAGNDSYVYGGGQDTIDNTGGGYDGVFFNNGILADDLAFSREGDDLLITVDGNASATVRVTNHFLGGDYAIDFVQPASGSLLNTAAINALAEDDGGNPGGGGNEGNDGDYSNVVTGTASGEQLLGTSGRDLIRGLAGNDTLFGFGGDDKFEGGDGDDYISGGNGSFSGSGNDILIGGNGNDTLVGEDGADMLIGGAGDDDYYYSAGSGSDTIDNVGGGTDWVFFNGIARERLSFHQDGDDLLIRVDASAASQVRVLGHFLGGGQAISYVQPGSGYAIPASEIPGLLTSLPQGFAAVSSGNASVLAAEAPESAGVMLGTGSSRTTQSVSARTEGLVGIQRVAVIQEIPLVAAETGRKPAITGGSGQPTLVDPPAMTGGGLVPLLERWEHREMPWDGHSLNDVGGGWQCRHDVPAAHGDPSPDIQQLEGLISAMAGFGSDRGADIMPIARAEHRDSLMFAVQVM